MFIMFNMHVGVGVCAYMCIVHGAHPTHAHQLSPQSTHGQPPPPWGPPESVKIQ